MGVMSHEQFKNAVNAGGASRMLHTNEEVPTGPASRGTYSVGLQGHELVSPGSVSRQQVIEHQARLREDPTLRSDPSAMQGGWMHKGDAYLDASRRVVGRKEAVAAGHEGAQIAVYDMGHGEYGRDVYMKRPEPGENFDPTKQRIRGSRRTGYVVKDRVSPRA